MSLRVLLRAWFITPPAAERDPRQQDQARGPCHRGDQQDLCGDPRGGPGDLWSTQRDQAHEDGETDEQPEQGPNCRAFCGCNGAETSTHQTSIVAYFALAWMNSRRDTTS